MDEEQKAEIKDNHGEIDKQGIKTEEKGADLLKGWVVFDGSILEKKGAAQTCKTDGDETKAITTSDESTKDPTDKSKEMMLPNGNTFDNKNEPMNSSAASPPASPFESDFAPKFEAANATEDGKENANKENSADKQTENASTGEDERHATEIAKNKHLRPQEQENNLKNNEGTKHLEPCDKQRVPEVLDEKAVEEEYSQAKCVINVEKALFIDKLFTQKVLLETFSISGREVSGCVASAVKGDESLTVLIRYTTDSWKSFAEEEAVPSTTDTDQIYKKFSFAISVPIGSSLEFAIECLKGDFMCWDNNNESNYFVENCVEMGEFGTLVARFLIPIDAVFADHIRKKSLSLKKACFKGGEASIWMATNATSHELAGVRYTLDNWETSTNIKGCKIYETKHGKLGLGYDVCRASVKIPKGKTLIFVIFWHYDGHEFWDNNNEKNYEING
eukprot:Seg1508.7 transcript_id=Seg1508.7/GoldUCD/mRNA.D3Y31 product="hypothetical protein" protein_id=Seg1508.7/GoldUCD/D3Y31